MLVVLGELEMPVQLAGVCVQGQQRVAVKVVARTSLAAIRWRRVSRRPENLVGRRIVSSRVPRRRAADLPRIALPCLMSRLARPRHGVETPSSFAGRSVVGVNESAHPVLAAGYANHYE